MADTDSVFRQRGQIEDKRQGGNAKKPGLSHPLENIRVAYPSMSASVLFLVIAKKEGYFDMKKTTKVQREIKVTDIFDLSLVRKANSKLKASGWRP